MAQALKDSNRVKTELGVSTSDGITPLQLYIDSATGALKVSGDFGAQDLFGQTEYVSVYRPLTTNMSTTTGTGCSVSDSIEGVTLTTGGTTFQQVTCKDTAKLIGCGYARILHGRAIVPRVEQSGAAAVNIYFFLNNTTLASATKYMGFRLGSAGAIYAASKDGTTEETTDVSGSFGALGSDINRVLDVVLVPRKCVYFFINGVLVATHSTNFPASSDTTTDLVPFGVRMANSSYTGGLTLKCSSVAYSISM